MTGRASLRQISEAEFSRLLEMLSSTAKGRQFLDEYRRRLQPQETLGLLDSLHRIESTMGSVRDQLQPQRIAEELRHIAMSLDIAAEGAVIDPEGSADARRFALVDHARRELQTLAENLGSDAADPAAARPATRPTDVPVDAPRDGIGYRLRDPAPER